MKKLIPGFVALLLLIQFDIQAQSVRRSVIASIGDSGTAGGVYFSCTVAQPPNAGTLVNNGVVLRQGFQQPVSGSNTPGGTGCTNAPLADFVIDKILTSCGERFNFTYAGIPDPNTMFTWHLGQDALPPTSTTMNPTNVIYTSTGVKLITLEVTTDSCTFSKTYQATVSKASFGAFAQGSSVTCYDDKNGTVNLVPINGQTPYNYKWANGATTASLSNLGPGAYAFTVTDAIGCSCSGEGVVDGPDSIAVAPAVTVETCDGTKDGAVNLTVSGGQAPYSFLWSNGATTEDIGNLEGATYTVTVSDAAKCQKAVDIKVLTVCEGFVFTNLITPNDDGANDAWVVPGILSFPDNELTIFNRYGQVVFSKKGYDNTWRGENSDGNPLPVGAYWFILKLNDAADTVYSGSISILR